MTGWVSECSEDAKYIDTQIKCIEIQIESDNVH